jgi:peptidoglycan/LPS O-acetylase OafA/YrhL
VNAPTSYRPDIDGLRAIAVLSVIAYHFAPGRLTGGYLGVDIFFVISGYLITQIIHRELLDGRFSLRGFYERRVRRILPALLVVLACCAVVAALILLPSDLVRFGKALLATLAFVPNIFAWQDAGYFSPHADQKPLLHTWSLGVEEQFYLLFPLMLLLLARYWPRATLAVVAAITAASLALHALLLEYTSGTFAFFMLPTRAWEIGVGALVALVPHRTGVPDAAPGTRTIIAAIGLALIGWSLFAPRAVETAPILHAVAAVAGTALLIRAGQNFPSPVSRLVGAAPLAWVGLISYSLYLWHWPVIVFSKYYLVRGLEPVEVAAALVFMFAAAALSWRFVERPFRRREFPAPRVFVSAAAGTGVLAAAGGALLLTGGLPGRLSPEAARMNEAVGTHFHCDMSDSIGFGAERVCGLNLPSRNPADARLVLLGSSHAQMYAPVWRDILVQRGEAGILVPMTGCLPTVIANFDAGCARLASAKLQVVSRLPNVRTVVLGMTWFHGDENLFDVSGRPLDNHDHAALIHALDDLIARLRSQGKHVVLIGPIAVPGWDLASEASRSLAYGRRVNRAEAEPRSEFERRYATVFAHFTGREDVAFARPDRAQCDDKACSYVIDGRSLFSDANHLAAAEVGRFHDIFMAELE